MQVKKYVSADSIGPAEHDVATNVARMAITPRAPAALAVTSGELALPGGGKYVGQIKDGKPHGQGTCTDPDGTYVGQWKDGKQHGQGTGTGAGGSKYVGQFKDGRMHGEGTFTYASGGKYIGQYKDDNMHGFGKHTLADGTVFHDGEWENAQPKK